MAGRHPHFRSKKLNSSQVRQVASLYYVCKLSDEALAELYDLPHSTLADAKSRLAWLRQQTYLAKVDAADPTLGAVYDSPPGFLALLISTRRAPEPSLRERMHRWCCEKGV